MREVGSSSNAARALTRENVVASGPRQVLSRIDVLAMIVGLVIGAGIFKAPSVVAANTESAAGMLAAWLLGGAVSLTGALCYAELASSYPHTGGEYHFLSRAYGPRLAFLFAWSRLAVLQTGSIALLAFVLGDYLTEWLPLGRASSALYAVAAVLALTALNAVGLRTSATLQRVMTLVIVLGLLLVAAAGLMHPPPLVTAAASSPAAHPAFGLAMVFVLLTFGGWNESAYVSAEVRNVQRNMARVLVGAIGLITVLYVLVNLAFLNVLGLSGMRASSVVANDAMRLTVGNYGAVLITLLIVLAVLTSINVTILTGARTNYAMAGDVRLFNALGSWHDRTNAPLTALVVQAVVSLVLIAIGAFSRSGFETMVQYVSPVFWFFFLLTTVSLFVLRRRDPTRLRPFRVPFYPLTPIIFCATCVYMLYSSLAYTGFGALLGVAVLAAGTPLLFFLDRTRATRR
ncbi:MAG: APC family permease [Sulfurifustaceae bacterium]